MSASLFDEQISDYSHFDFAALWTGREKVTEVEREIVVRALHGGDCRRVIEVGTGFGRLLGTLTGLSDEVVATDFNVRGLSRVTVPSTGNAVLRVAANVYHLPFVSGAFTCATMVRVYHHLSEPAQALREIARVLRGGSRLLVSFNPKPSVGTFVNDVQRAIHRSSPGRFRSITFERGTTVLDPDPFPIYVASRREFEESVASAGLHPEREIVSGLEEYYLMRHLPARWFVRLGTTLGHAPAFPARFVLVVKEGNGSAPIPGPGELLACPQCGAPHPEWGQDRPLECGHCPFVGHRREGVLDLRYIPEGATRWEAPT